MARRNFGLSHVSPRASSRAQLPGLTARLLYSVERALQGVHHGFSKRERPTGQQIAVDVIYMGRVIFHVGDHDMYARVKSSQKIGEK